MTEIAQELTDEEFHILIQVLTHMTLETGESEFHTLIGVPTSKATALKQKIQRLAQKSNPDPQL